MTGHPPCNGALDTLEIYTFTVAVRRATVPQTCSKILLSDSYPPCNYAIKYQKITLGSCYPPCNGAQNMLQNTSLLASIRSLALTKTTTKMSSFWTFKTAVAFPGPKKLIFIITFNTKTVWKNSASKISKIIDSKLSQFDSLWIRCFWKRLQLFRYFPFPFVRMSRLVCLLLNTSVVNSNKR